MAGMAESLQDRLWQQEAIAVFGADPRVYTTTVKEFIKDKKGKLCKAVLVKLESKKRRKDRTHENGRNSGK